MKKITISFAVVVLLCITVLAQPQPNNRIETIQFQSKLVGAKLPYDVILVFCCTLNLHYDCR